jgi:hypothetical protein
MVDGEKTWVFHGFEPGFHKDGEIYGKGQTKDECIKVRDEFVAKFESVGNGLLTHDCVRDNTNLVYHGKTLDPWTLEPVTSFKQIILMN